jgi:hypothetical protein
MADARRRDPSHRHNPHNPRDCATPDHSRFLALDFASQDKLGILGKVLCALAVAVGARCE